MNKVVTATEAKATILALLDEVEGGDEVEITRHGRPVARLVPTRRGRSLKGRHVGVARSDADDELFSTGERWDLA